MKIGKRVKRGCVLALAGMLALPGLSLLRTQAAGAIDTEASCSLTVTVEDSQYISDFDKMSIPVSIYQVADVDSVGKYTTAEAFAGLDVGSISSATTAQDWADMARKADEIREAAGDAVKPAATQDVEKAEGGSQPAEAVFRDLHTGMYLIVPAETYNSDYSVKYVFTPYLTALPGNAYASTGEGSDEWNYNPVVGLKAEGERQYGKLTITKNLSSYNASLGQCTFVFEVTGRDENNAVVYSNVVSTTHDAAGSQSVVLEDIPAGTIVTVKEIYAGNYAADGSDSATAVIVTEEAVEAGIASEEAAVTISNTYDGGNRGGYGVTNHFEADGNGGWTWENPTRPVPQENN